MLLLDGLLEKVKVIVEEHINDNHKFLDGNTNDRDTQDGLIENNPTESDTIGSLCNKLNSVCIQMWHNQEFLYAVRKMTPEEFKGIYGGNLSNLHRIIKRCCDLNYQRSLLMDAIDKKAVEVASGHIR